MFFQIRRALPSNALRRYLEGRVVSNFALYSGAEDRTRLGFLFLSLTSSNCHRSSTLHLSTPNHPRGYSSFHGRLPHTPRKVSSLHVPLGEPQATSPRFRSGPSLLFSVYFVLWRDGLDCFPRVFCLNIGLDLGPVSGCEYIALPTVPCCIFCMPFLGTLGMHRASRRLVL